MVDKELLLLKMLREIIKNKLQRLENMIVIREKNNFIRKLLLRGL